MEDELCGQSEDLRGFSERILFYFIFRLVAFAQKTIKNPNAKPTTVVATQLADRQSLIIARGGTSLYSLVHTKRSL
ncbi:hypothetical protein BK671_15850 [Pseudomonas fluorescens]|uniref:Uncharacterized protein n=1 Tax=Pseudomonas fluorescens TaxID=294 RepID=A0A423LDT5_PSEFL|nr:hypothetical protein BK671_15850 [Pseudomonas fluorescens]